jgi:hypothetical protein
VQTRKAHSHVFGFGEETCEICGMPFTETQTHLHARLDPHALMQTAPRRRSTDAVNSPGDQIGSHDTPDLEAY